MRDFAAIDFETANEQPSSVCGYELANHHHALADAEACAVIAMQLL